MRSRSLSFIACASFLLTLVMLMPNRAMADSITITQGLGATVKEGQGGSITYTVTNTGGGEVTLSTLGFGMFFDKKGDLTDMPIASPLTGTCGVGTKLVPHATCTIIFNFTTGNDAPEGDDGIIGTSSVTVVVGTNTFVTSTKGTINVEDVAANAPEPSTYLLFGTGLVGIAGMIRRKLRM